MNATAHLNEGGSLIVTTTGPDAAAARTLLDRIRHTAKEVGDLTLRTEQAVQRHLTNLRAGEMPFADVPTNLQVQVASLAAYVDAAEVVGLGDVAKKVVATVMTGDSVAIKAEPVADMEADRNRIAEALSFYVERAGWIKPVDAEKAEYERLAAAYAPHEH